MAIHSLSMLMFRSRRGHRSFVRSFVYRINGMNAPPRLRAYTALVFGIRVLQVILIFYDTRVAERALQVLVSPSSSPSSPSFSGPVGGGGGGRGRGARRDAGARLQSQFFGGAIKARAINGEELGAVRSILSFILSSPSFSRFSVRSTNRETRGINGVTWW